MSLIGTFGPSSCRFFLTKKLENGGERDDRRLRKKRSLVREKRVVALRTKVTFRSSRVNLRASWEYIKLYDLRYFLEEKGKRVIFNRLVSTSGILTKLLMTSKQSNEEIFNVSLDVFFQ